MIPTPALGVRFDIDRLGGGAYGLQAWKIFWQAVSPAAIPGGFLYEGDSSATLSGAERVFVIAVHHQDLSMLQRVAVALNASTGYQAVAASPDLSWNEAVAPEPLPDAGNIDGRGLLLGGFWSRSALDAMAPVTQGARATAELHSVSAFSCPNCGTAFVLGDAFCGECGTPLAQRPAPGRAILPLTVPSRPGRPPTWLWVVLGIVGVLVIGASGAIVLTRTSDDEPASSGRTSESSGGSGVSATSPSGLIAFRSTRDGQGDIYTMNVNGGELRRVTEHPNAENWPSWSPDGKKIAFSRLNAPNVPACLPDCTSDIFVIDVNGGSEVRLTNTPESEFDPAWSPDGKRIAFSSAGDQSEIFVMNADGSKRTQLTQNSLEDSSPSWSPDGKRLVFDSGPVESASDETLIRDVMVMNADGTGLRALTKTPEAEFYASWSPDGKKIVFAKGNFRTAVIHVMNSDGSNVRALEATGGGAAVTPTWSPDGKWILYRNDRGFFLVGVDGGSLQQIPRTSGEDWGPVWRRSP